MLDLSQPLLGSFRLRALSLLSFEGSLFNNSDVIDINDLLDIDDGDDDTFPPPSDKMTPRS